MLERLKNYWIKLKKYALSGKKEYFTVIILPGPNSRVRKYSFSKLRIRNGAIIALFAFVLSFAMFGEYFHMRGKVWELDTLKIETKQQHEQIQVFAANIVDMKGQMAKLKEMSDKLGSMAHIGNKKGQQFLGIGGREMSTVSLDELGKKTQKEMLEQMSQELDGLKSEAAEQETNMAKLTEFFQHRNSTLSCTPSIWPVRGFVTSEFGYRTSPIYGTKQFHEGLDIANAIGTPVVAPANGVVAEAGYSSGYGKCIKIQHGYGLVSLYGHLSVINVTPGQRVKKGDLIGNVGNTGSSTGPHLHYEIWVNGIPTNPKKYI